MRKGYFKKNGFTLIELLAVIVILGLLAVLIVPKVTKTIKSSRENINKASASGLIRVADNYYMDQKLKGGFQGCTYDFTNNSNTCEGIEFSGEKPESGFLTIGSNGDVSCDLNFGDYNYKQNATVIPYHEGTLVGTNQFYDGGSGDTPDNIVYFDPVNNQKCTNYHADNSKTGFNGIISGAGSTKTTNNQTSCLKWFLYSIDDKDTLGESDDIVNMLLDHNITAAQANNGAWALETDYTDQKSASAGITYPGIGSIPAYSSSKNARGPVTALNTLKSLTSEWKTQTPKVPNSTSTNEHIIPSSQNDNKYQIDYTGYKARLITIEESNYLGCIESNNISCATWLVENTNVNESVFGYWTSSPYIGDPDIALEISYIRTVMNWLPVDDTGEGVRPVITVSLSDVLS